MTDIRYVGLSYDSPDFVRWDYGDWHWPEVGVEFATLSGRSFHAIWDDQVEAFELRFAEGPLSDEWLPLQPGSAEPARVWNVTAHPRWQRLVGSPVESFELVDIDLGDMDMPAPVAIRLWTRNGGAVWIVAAAPRDEAHAHEDLTADDVFVGHDEIIVVFGDARARRIGLLREAEHELT